jgi:hypothetical protein
VGADSTYAGDHVHVDHLFVGVASALHVVGAELPFRWYAAGGLQALRMFPDTRTMGGALLDAADELDVDVMLAM